MVLLFLFWPEEHLKKKKNKKKKVLVFLFLEWFVSRTTMVRFWRTAWRTACFKNRSSSAALLRRIQRKEKKRTACFKNSKKCLFQENNGSLLLVSRTAGFLFLFCCLFQEFKWFVAACFKNRSSWRTACFKNRSSFLLLVSRTALLFFCLFQEPLKETAACFKKRTACFKNSKKRSAVLVFSSNSSEEKNTFYSDLENQNTKTK